MLKKRIAWNKGLKGVQVAWNKGKTHTEEHRNNLSKALQGRIPWNKGLKGVQKAWNKGKPRTWETSGDFKKGQQAWNKGIKRYWDSPTEFEKGDIPYNKGVFTSENMAAIHYWIKKIKGEPKKCEHCGTITAKAYHWSNKDHKYSKNPEDYQRLCVSCHLKYDYKFNKRSKSNGNTI